MIDDLKPYPAYKDSGVEWLSEVPEHWEVVPLCRVGRPKKVTNCVDRELLSVYLHHGVIRFSDIPDKRTNPTSEDLSKYQAVDYGDFVLNNQQAWRGSVGVSKYSGIVSPAYLVLTLNGVLDTAYADRLLQDRSMVDQYLVCSKGVGSIQRNLYWPHLKRVSVPIPPPPEQTAIARFLDYMDQLIRRVIRARQRRIKLLEEYKQALIHQAVTGQIDVRTGQPYPAYKDSGVEWLSEVPEHWEVGVGHGCFVEKKEPNIGLIETTVLSLSYGRIVVKPLEKLRGLVPASFETYQIIDPGDIVCRPTDLQNDQNSLRFGLARNRGIITSAYMSLRTTGRLDSDFGYLLLHAYDIKKIFYGLGSGLRQNLDWRDFKRLPCLVPPLPEQTAIVEYLDAQITKIDAAIASARREIKLLREYRTRLISDVVTGKADVREAAARLPEELSEEEAESMDAGGIVEDEATDDDTAAETLSEEEAEP
jgi:type I restriction enzyme S subunit